MLQNLPAESAPGKLQGQLPFSSPARGCHLHLEGLHCAGSTDYMRDLLLEDSLKVLADFVGKEAESKGTLLLLGKVGSTIYTFHYTKSKPINYTNVSSLTQVPLTLRVSTAKLEQWYAPMHTSLAQNECTDLLVALIMDPNMDNVCMYVHVPQRLKW